MPILSNLSFDSTDAPAVGITGLFESRNIFIEDRDGTMNPLGSQGFYVNNSPHMRSFIDSDLCDDTNFCKNTCLRRVMIDTGCCSQKHSSPPVDYQMVVTSKTDPAKTFVFDKYLKQSGLWYFANQFDVVLPLDDYSVHFLRVSDGLIMVPPVTLTFDDETNLDDPPACDHVTEDSFEYRCPEEYPYLSSDGVTCTDTTTSPTSSPTISAPPPAPEKSYYLVCGGSHKLAKCGKQTAVALASEQHEVRCCRDEALTGWTKNKRCPYNVWGESVLKAVPDAPGNGCYHAETYESASDICEANNGRLCTKEELLGDCSRGTGCIHDNDLIWSSTPVPESPATCKAATQECNASSECCSGECFGDLTCA